jgi:hypothetical protein
MNIRFLSVLENFDKRFDTDDLDEFRDLVGSSLKRQERALTKDAESLKLMEDDDDENAAGYASHIEDRWMLLRDVDNLTGQLLIVALYRQTELHIKRVVKRTHPAIDTSKLFNFKALKSAIPFNIEALPKFASFNELRILNNAVKHQGKVSDELSQNFQNWKLGEELTGLDTAYERLKPEIAEFISAFVAGCYKAKKQP